MREDMEAMGPVRLRDVDEAQMAMVAVAKDLAAKGEIMLAGAAAATSWSIEIGQRFCDPRNGTCSIGASKPSFLAGNSRRRPPSFRP